MSYLAQRRPHWLHDRIMSPYSVREGIGCVWRNLFPNWSNAQGLASCEQNMIRHPGIAPMQSIGFLGDIMDSASQAIEIDASVTEFFADCDAVVGNLEACIAPPKTHRQQNRHSVGILNDLSAITAPERLYLSVANNHAADYGESVFRDSVRQFQAAGYCIFGTRERPFMDLGANIRIATGSQWTNMPCDYITDLADITAHHASDRFNVLYPHWGYEMEYAPRPEMLNLSEQWLAKADAVIGHHSHLPQPLFWRQISGREKLIAPSLGDFCCRYRYTADKFYKHGVIAKLRIGRLPTGVLDIVNMDWRMIEGSGKKAFTRVDLCHPGFRPSRSVAGLSSPVAP